MVKKFSHTGLDEKLYQLFITLVTLFMSAICLFPLLYILSLSLVNESEYIQRGGFVLFPQNPTLMAYKRLFKGTVFLHALEISIIRTILAITLCVTMSVIAGYIVSRKYMPGRKIFIVMIITTILFTGGLIPTYLVVSALKLRDTIWALVIPGLIDSFNVLVLKQFFENVPLEVEESARIDGIGEVALMVRILVPMSLPAIAAISMFVGINTWNSWFDAMIYINDSKLFPLTLLIRNSFVYSDLGSQFNPSSVIDPDNRVSTETLRMALVIFGTLPILSVYPFLQKYFKKGVYLGSVKG